MKIYLRSVWIVPFLFCIAYLYSSAQPPEEIVSRRYFMEDGLSYNYINCLFQDSKGFLWIGTESGLNRFDGYHFAKFLENPLDKYSLSNNYISCLWEDSLDRLWVGTDNGLELLDLTSGKFLSPKEGLSDITLFSNLRILRFRERADGTIWVCTDQGIYQIDPLSLTIIKDIIFPYDTNGKTNNRDNINGNYFRDIVETEDGSIIAGSEGGLVYIRATTKDTVRYRSNPNGKSSLSHDVVWTLSLDSSNNIWVGTSKGLDLFDPIEQSFTHFLPNRLKNSSTSVYGLYAQNIAERRDHKLWVGFSSGLYTFDPQQETFDLVKTMYCSALLQDQQNVTWLGSIDGLYQITVPTKKMKVYSPFESTTTSGVAGLVEDREEQIWIVASAPDRANYSLFRHNPDNTTFLEYPSGMPNQGKNLYEGFHEVAVDNNSSLWLASMAKLERYNYESEIVNSFDLPIDPHKIFVDSKGRIWIGEWSGLGVFDPYSNN